MSKLKAEEDRLLAAHTSEELEALKRATHRQTRLWGVAYLLVAMPVLVWVERWRLATSAQEPTAPMMAALIILLFAGVAFAIRLYRHDGPIENACARSRARAAIGDESEEIG